MTDQALRKLLDFDDPADVALFAPVDDAVMGGVSSSRFAQVSPGIAAFEGMVSLENGGGFASVRSRSSDWDTRGIREFVLCVRGDGKRYRFNVRTPGTPAAFRYEAPLDLPDTAWTEVTIPVTSLAARAFGQPVPRVGPADPAGIRSLGFMISDRQAGAFRLEIDWIACR